MRKILLATTAIAALGIGPALAQETPMEPKAKVGAQTEAGADATTEDAGFGAAAGGATGAIAGAVVGGPIGAIVGGFAGAVLGAETAVPEQAVAYVEANPVEPVTLEGQVAAGTAVPQGVTLQPIPDYPDYAYVYTERRPLIVRADTREIVYSPGYVVPEQTIEYVRANPVDPVQVEARVGVQVPAEVELRPVPSDPHYAYVYLDGGPALVDAETRTVVWVR
ncbi:DUF1236 domain-containing protein [Aquibium sp. A9E412]|uniref:DUF1236 domain-containing protein n=1 Tax=Aquibium sp. A9E412 TaxID=2976767 RepID=UPI0025B24D3C|nr:DUF1236 domain-containing protein [Aquibium sp. A9E412]MDN2566182.1 DUF1236 domain-containing protein [Aquibium sp. A9E412]